MPFLTIEGKKYRVGDLAGEDPFWTISVEGKRIALEELRQPLAEAQTIFVRAGGRIISVLIRRSEGQRAYSVEVNGRPLTLTIEEDTLSLRNDESSSIDGPAIVNSPMAGKIATVKAIVDSKVEEGQSLMVLEAMKMQNEIASPKTGIVKELYVKHGDLVKAGDKLCLIE
jgi:biotin carboxyl carrier protein